MIFILSFYKKKNNNFFKTMSDLEKYLLIEQSEIPNARTDVSLSEKG